MCNILVNNLFNEVEILNVGLFTLYSPSIDKKYECDNISSNFLEEQIDDISGTGPGEITNVTNTLQNSNTAQGLTGNTNENLSLIIS